MRVQITDKQEHVVVVRGEKVTVTTFRRTGGMGPTDFGYEISSHHISGVGQRTRAQALQDAKSALWR